MPFKFADSMSTTVDSVRIKKNGATEQSSRFKLGPNAFSGDLMVAHQKRVRKIQFEMPFRKKIQNTVKN